MLNTLQSWLSQDAFTAILILAAGLICLAASLTRARLETDTFWPWVRRLVQALVQAGLLVAALGAFLPVLTANHQVFNAVCGGFAEQGTLAHAGMEAARQQWGGFIAQEELAVQFFVEKEIKEELPRADLSQPPQYRTDLSREQLVQDGLAGFTGQVQVELGEVERRARGEPVYNVYSITVRYVYQVVNAAAVAADAEFTFPLPREYRLLQNFAVQLGGRDIGAQVRLEQNQLKWTTRLAPQAQTEVVIAFATTGTEAYVYRVPAQHPLRQWQLFLSLDGGAYYTVGEPADALQGDYRPRAAGAGGVLSWRADNLIAAPKVGIVFAEPERPYAPCGRVLRVLEQAPLGWLLLGALLALTLLIGRQPLNLLQVVFLGGCYCAEFWFITAWVGRDCAYAEQVLPAAGLLLVLLAGLLFRRRPPGLLKVCVYGWVLFFTGVYPYVYWRGQLAPEMFESLLRVGIILYVFGLTLYIRLRQPVQAAPAAG